MTTILRLTDHPRHVAAAARMVHEEFWTDRPGHSAERMAARMREADPAGGVPMTLVALDDDDAVAGVVNLVDNDDEQRAHLRPWLAGLVVRQDLRGRGIGSALVQALLAEARRLRIETVYFGTDGPDFYERLGARLHEQVTGDFCIMKFDM
jgi:predicted N-acetyltransferase YhbS